MPVFPFDYWDQARKKRSRDTETDVSKCAIPLSISPVKQGLMLLLSTGS